MEEKVKKRDVNISSNLRGKNEKYERSEES
jgi:hypothetical protein